ncbi:general substrate transporter [Hypoxylon sp. FL1150]|nr:general substrate transporter [Hypoxylon sp. FL1150]
MGSLSTVQPFKEAIGLPGSDAHTTLLVGVIGSMYWIGVVAGALLVGWVSGYIGRRKAIVCACITGFTIIPIFTALQSYAWAVTLRTLNGLASGALDAACVTWSAETASHHHRGRAIGAELAASAGGAALAYFTIFALSTQQSGDVIFRLPIALQCAFILLVFCSIWFFPESPRWLVSTGRIADASDILKYLEGKANADENDENLEARVAEKIRLIEQAVEEEQRYNASTNYLAMLFRRDKFKTARRTWSALFIQFSCQFLLGAGIVAAYGTEVFQQGGWSASTSALVSGFTLLCSSIFGFVGAFLLADRMKRTVTMVWGALGMALIVAMIGLCAHFAAKYIDTDPPLAKRYSIALMTLQLIWSSFLGLGWLWCAWTYPAEMFTAQSRAKGVSLGVIGFALGAFMCNMVGAYIFAAIGHYSFFVICGMSVFVAAVCWLFMPETRGITLEDADHLFNSKGGSQVGFSV